MAARTTRIAWPWALGAAAIAGVGAVALAVGPGAAPLVDLLADGRRAGPLGAITLDGVSGPHLGALAAQRLSLRDKDGVWAEAEGLSLEWRPLGLLAGKADIDALKIDRLVILRRPTLTPTRPRADTPDAALSRLEIARLDLAEGVAGKAASFTVSMAVETKDQALQRLSASAIRTDGGGDRITLAAEGGKAPTLSASLEGPKGGAFASFLGAPVSGALTAKDQKIAGALAFFDKEAATLTGAWTDTSWTLTADGELAAVPAASALAAWLGPRAAMTAEGARSGTSFAGPFTARLAAPFVSASASGVLADNGTPSGAITLKAEGATDRIGFPGATARIEGPLILQDGGFTLNGSFDLSRARLADVAFRAGGKVAITLDPAALQVDTDIQRTDVLDGPLMFTSALAGARGKASVGYNRANGALTLETLALSGPAFSVEGKGGLGRGERLTGRFQLKDLAKPLPGIKGAATGQWAYGDDRLTVSGKLAGVRGLPEPADQLVGGAPTFSADLGLSGSLTTVMRATLESAKLRLGARGDIRDGAADLQMEASARGPLTLNGLRIAGAGDATGRLTGPLDRLGLQGKARLATLDLGGAQIFRPQIILELDPGLTRGRIRADGIFLDRPLALSADLAAEKSSLSLTDLAIRLAEARAAGAARFAAEGPRADMMLSGRWDGLWPGAAGALDGALAVRPGPTQPLLNLTATLRQGRLGEGVSARAASLSAAGPLDELAFKASAQGQVETGAAYRLSASGTSGFSPTGWRTALTGQGDVAGVPINIASPAQILIGDGVSEAKAQLSVAGGRLALDWAQRQDRIDFVAKAEALPLSPLARRRNQLAGTLDGEARLQGAGDKLSGTVRARVTGAALARSASDPIDATLTADLRDGALKAEASAQSAGGLKARVTALAFVDAQSMPLRIARDLKRTARLTWTAEGPVEGFWAVFGPLDQAVSGRVSGDGEISVTGQSVSGSGALLLSGGTFEDKISGLALTDVNARIALSEAGAQLEAFSARDAGNGRLTGKGALTAAGAGKLELEGKDLRLINRPDIKARGDAALLLSWTAAGATLSGDVRVLEAEAAPPAIAASPPATIEVVEINRPLTDDQPTNNLGSAQTSARAFPVRLDLTVRAPRRVFTRGRGVEAEWALDARVTGDPAAPDLAGEARLLRGSATLAGRRFAMDDGLVTFRGPIEEAEIALAATLSGPDLSATVRLSGDLLNPDVAFSSTPALPEDEVLPRALFGQGAADLSPLQAAQLAASLATLSGQAAFDVAAAARRAVDLDRLDVRQEAGQVLVTGGKYISRDVYLEVSRGALGAASTQVEWQVRPRFFVISSFLPEGDQRIAIRWRRSY